MARVESLSARLLLTLGALNGLGAVALGAYGAHGLHGVTTDDRAIAAFQTAVQYHGWHALALILAGLAAERYGGRCLHGAGWLFALGILFFCGAIYAVTLGAPEALRAITPFGGGSLMVGWAALACGFWKDSAS